MHIHVFRDPPTKAELLKAARSKPVQLVDQFDCHFGIGPGDAMTGDADGDAVHYGRRYELMRSTDLVRVHIPIAIPKVHAVRALKKILSWIEKDFDEDMKKAENYERELARLRRVHIDDDGVPY